MILKKREDTGISNRKYCIVSSGELTLKEAMDLSKDKNT
jgi:hypothetical protein